MDVFADRSKKMAKQDRLIRDCREVEYELFDEKEQGALKSFQEWSESGRLLTWRQFKWLLGMHTKACAYDERGGKD